MRPRYWKTTWHRVRNNCPFLFFLWTTTWPDFID
jgi:hypothetical protein